MAPALLVLAAGLGSRYGGLKQIEPVGPSGETLLDYAVFDALRAGFGRVVFLIRRDIEGIFRERIGARYGDRAALGFAFQDLADLPAGFALPPGRSKPWGTGHAVWCARTELGGPFAVINADDFYGADSFKQLGSFLANPGEARFALAGFRLADTLSEHGAVARGICRIEGGRLRSIAEQPGIAAADVGAGRRFSGDEIVSMNCWGFTPGLFPLLEERLRAFLSGNAGESRAEFYLPEAVSSMVSRGEAEVGVIRTPGPWFGITHPDDKPRVVSAIAGLVRSGAYPAKLF
jgi:NDP-sugar pyrophosphorylase family protein